MSPIGTPKVPSCVYMTFPSSTAASPATPAMADGSTSGFEAGPLESRHAVARISAAATVTARVDRMDVLSGGRFFGTHLSDGRPLKALRPPARQTYVLSAAWTMAGKGVASRKPPIQARCHRPGVLPSLRDA